MRHKVTLEALKLKIMVVPKGQTLRHHDDQFMEIFQGRGSGSG